MDEFLREYYNILVKGVELIAAITAIVTYKKYKNTTAKYFLWFLIYVFLIELIGGYTVYVSKYEFLANIKTALKDTLIEKNFWWFNIFWRLGSALFFSSFFILIIKTKLYKNILIWARAIFLISTVSYTLFNLDQLFNTSIVFNTILGAFLVLLSSVMYFLEILQSEKILTFYKSIYFFIAATVFIWFLVITPIIFYQAYYSTADWNFVLSRRLIFLLCNMFMYLTFTFALLWCKPQND